MNQKIKKAAYVGEILILEKNTHSNLHHSIKGSI